jgi:hypothetical protein
MVDAHHILNTVLAAYAGRSIRDVDAMSVFGELGARVPGLKPDDIAGAADLAKLISSELRSVAWRLQTAAENDRRKNRSASIT